MGHAAPVSHIAGSDASKPFSWTELGALAHPHPDPDPDAEQCRAALSRSVRSPVPMLPFVVLCVGIICTVRSPHGSHYFLVVSLPLLLMLLLLPVRALLPPQ